MVDFPKFGHNLVCSNLITHKIAKLKCVAKVSHIKACSMQDLHITHVLIAKTVKS